MTGFKWLNLELKFDKDGRFRYYTFLDGEFLKVQAATPPPSLFGGMHVMPEYWAQKINGHFGKVIEKKNLVRLLIPIMGS